MMTKVNAVLAFFCALLAVTLSGTALSSDSAQMDQVRAQFASAFNDRNWDTVATLFAPDAVFHRANGDTIYTGPEQIVARFKDTIAGAWNVQFTHLDNTASVSGTGDDTRTVDTGLFAVTAGPDSDACYAGFYAITWSKDMKILVLGWQDVLTDMSACQ